MKFNFPDGKKKESVTISIYLRDIDRVRKLAEIHNCTINDIYTTLINEALDDYEDYEGAIKPKEAGKVYSHKRDLNEAGDGKRRELNKPVMLNPKPDAGLVVEKTKKKAVTDKYMNQIYKNESDPIKTPIINCDYEYCSRRSTFLKGTGVEYGIKNFCSTSCRDLYIKQEDEKLLGEQTSA